MMLLKMSEKLQEVIPFYLYQSHAVVCDNAALQTTSQEPWLGGLLLERRAVGGSEVRQHWKRILAATFNGHMTALRRAQPEPCLFKSGLGRKTGDVGP